MIRPRIGEREAAGKARAARAATLRCAPEGTPMRRIRSVVVALLVGALVLAPTATLAEAPRCGERSADAAMWYSIAHPGLGEWYLNGWGYFFENAPQLKFWLGFIPFYGWPGYLQVRSAIDARNCRTLDRAV